MGLNKVINYGGTRSGKNIQVLLQFIYEGKKRKSVTLSTPEGDFLSPKAVEEALQSQKEEMKKIVENRIGGIVSFHNALIEDRRNGMNDVDELIKEQNATLEVLSTISKEIENL